MPARPDVDCFVKNKTVVSHARVNSSSKPTASRRWREQQRRCGFSDSEIRICSAACKSQVASQSTAPSQIPPPATADGPNAKPLCWCSKHSFLQREFEQQWHQQQLLFIQLS